MKCGVDTLDGIHKICFSNFLILERMRLFLKIVLQCFEQKGWKNLKVYTPKIYHRVDSRHLHKFSLFFFTVDKGKDNRYKL